MWGGAGSPPAVVATSASPWLLPSHAGAACFGFCFRLSPLRPAATKERRCLSFRSPLARGLLLLPEGARLCPLWNSSLASHATRDGSVVPCGLLGARCSSSGAAGGALLWWRDAGAAALVMGGAYALVFAFDILTQRDLIDQKLSRKIVHVLSGILFMLSWPIFSSSTEARFFAALVPLANSLRLAVYGLSLATDEGLIKSVTREGKAEELLRGPLYYVLVLTFCALVFWRDSPVGVISLAMMSGGDGIADIMGRKFGMVKLPYNKQKSWVGSICMFTFGFFISMGMLYYFSSMGYFRFDWGQAGRNVALVSLTATLVESLPITNVLDDNVSVPLASVLVAALLFGYETY